MTSGFDNQGLALGEVYGFRWWTFVTAPSSGPVPPPFLRGQFGPWQPGENRAECKFAGGHDTPAPDEGCGCGMWAYWTPSAAPIPAGRRVAGVVKGWGDTLIGDVGCRCQLARIVALCFETIAQRAHRYEEQAWDATPPPGVRWRQPEGAMSTYLALGGRPVYMPGVRVVTEYVDDLYGQASDEYQLARAYDVPVYTTIEAMLAHHPLTADYLPPPPSIEELSKLLAAIQAEVNKMIPHVLSGAQALAQLNAKIAAAPEVPADLPDLEDLIADPPPWLPLLGGES